MMTMKTLKRISELPAVRLLMGISLGSYCTLSYTAAGGTLGFQTLLGQVMCAAAALVVVVGIIVALRRHWTALQTVLYWFCAIGIGVWIAHDIQSSTGRLYEHVGNNNRKQSQSYSSQLLPEMDAVVKGEIVRVLRRDSTSVRCLVRGIVDTRALPRFNNVHFVLAISARTPQETRKMEMLRSGVTLYTTAIVHFPREAELSTDFPEPQYCAALGAQMMGSASVKHVGIIHERTTLFTLAESVSEQIERRVFRLFPSALSSAFAIALVTGNTALLTQQTKREYALAGTAHVLAVSGLHVALVAAILLIPLQYLRADTLGRRCLQWLLFVLAIACYVLVTGCAPSGVRAAVMAALLRLAWVAERHRYYRAEHGGGNSHNDNGLWLLNVLALSIVLMLLADATLVYALGFQFSVAALAGIALFYERMYAWCWCTLGCSRLGGGGRLLASSFAMTLASSSIAQVLVAWYFGTVSLIAPVANLTAVPLSSLAVLWSSAALVSSYLPGIGIWAGETFAWAAHGCITLMDGINSWCARVGAGITNVPLAQGNASAMHTVVALWSFCISCVVVYCTGSRSPRQTLFRVGASVVALWCVVVLYQHEVQKHARKHTVSIIARSRVVAAVVLTERTRIVLLQDRCPTSPYTVVRNDIALARWIVEMQSDKSQNDKSQSDKPLLLCATGVHSLQTASAVARYWHHNNHHNWYDNSHDTNSSANTNRLRCTVLITSLQHKHTRQWQALDTLQKYAIPVVHASTALRRAATQGDSALTLLDRRSTDHDISVEWLVWQAALRLRQGTQDTIIALPKVLSSFVWETGAQRHIMPIQR